MKKLLIGILLASLATLAMAKDIDVTKSKGIEQSVIVSLTPTPADMNTAQNVVLKAVFDVELDAKHVQKNNVKLKHITQTKETIINGNVDYVANQQAVTFTPQNLLLEGYYEVEFKSLKAVKSNKSQLIKEIKYRFYVSGEEADTIAPTITLNGESTITLVQGSTYTELGANALDDKDGDIAVSITGSVDTSTEGTYTITYTATDSAGNEAKVSRTVHVIVPIFTSISLESDVDVLNVGESTTLILTGNYSDDTTAPLTFTDVEWMVSPTDSLQINDNVLTASKESKVTLQAKLDTLLSNSIEINIATVINGYVLPPEPDPAVNNATLLGVDSNDNGVRDDVERYIIKTYKDEKIAIEIGFQLAKAFDMVIENPANAEETMKVLDAAQDCETYFDTYAKLLKEDFYLGTSISSKAFRSMILNTKERIREYLTYDRALSGGVYESTKIKDMKSQCSFDVEQMLKDR